MLKLSFSRPEVVGANWKTAVKNFGEREATVVTRIQKHYDV